MLFENSCLGVDVSGEDIKIVELTKRGGKYEVVQAVRIKSGGNIGDTLRDFVQETKTQVSKIVFSIPSNECAIKFAYLPKSNSSDMAKMVRYEAETQIPLPLSDLSWNWSIEKGTKDSTTSHAIIGGVRRTIIDESAASMTDAGLAVSGAAIASLAEVRGLTRTLKRYNEPILLLDIGRKWTDIIAVNNCRVVACHTVLIGLDGLARSAAKDLGISFSEAYEFINDRSILQRLRDTDNGNVGEWFNAIGNEIRRAVFAMAAMEVQPITKAILAGDGAAITAFAEKLAERSMLQIQIADPWQQMSLATAATYNRSDISASFAVATGLAISGFDKRDFIDLLPKERAEGVLKQRKTLALIAGLSLVTVFLFMALIVGNSDVNAKSAELDQVRMQVKSARKHCEAGQPTLKSASNTIQSILKEAKEKRNSPIDILLKLSEGMPRSCMLSDFQYQSGKSVVVRGSALSESAVADAVYMLANAGIFTSVSLDYSNLGRSKDSSGYDFQIKCALPENTSLAMLSKKGAKKGRLIVR